MSVNLSSSSEETPEDSSSIKLYGESSSSEENNSSETVSIKQLIHFASAVDDYQLVGHLFSTNKSTTRGQPAKFIIINSATGVHQTFYFAFADSLVAMGQEQGINLTVLTYDYRGMGLSRKTKKPILDCTYLDWAKDFWGAIRFMITTVGAPEVSVIGHSIGCHMLLTTPPELGKYINRVLMVSSYNAYFGYCQPFTSLAKLWNYVNVRLFFWSIPLLAPVYGYFPSGSFWKIMEDLPTGVAKQWNYFQHQPKYMVRCDADFITNVENLNSSDPNQAVISKGLDHVEIMAWAFDDDLYGNENSLSKFNENFYGKSKKFYMENVKTPLNSIHDQSEIWVGHVGFFKKVVRDNTSLWRDAFDFIIFGKVNRDKTSRVWTGEKLQQVRVSKL